MNNARCRIAILAATVLIAGPQQAWGQTARPVIDDAALASAARSADEWLTIGRDYAETRFSPLEQIDSRNVSRLGVAWQYDTDSLRGLEATPLVANGVLYASTPWSNVFALDARTGKELWRWDARADRVRGARACCDVVNRGVAIYKDKIFVGVVDGRLVALDAATGALRWEVQTTPVDQPYTITGAPRVVDGKVVIGNGGAELGSAVLCRRTTQTPARSPGASTRYPAIRRNHSSRRRSRPPRKRGPASGGSSAAAARLGTGSRTTRTPSSCMSAPATARRGIRACGAPAAATIFISRRSSRYGSRPASSYGTTRRFPARTGTTPRCSSSRSRMSESAGATAR